MAIAIVLAAGSSSRFGGNKLFQAIADKPLLYFSLKQLQDCPVIEKIIVALNKNDFVYATAIVEEFEFNKVIEFAKGGDERQRSVFNCLEKIDKANTDIIVIHDAARPIISDHLLNAGFDILRKRQVDGAIPVLPVSDTLKKLTDDNLIDKTISRDNIYMAQTPQFYKFDVFLDCHKKAKMDNVLGTDDAFLLESYGYKVVCFTGDNKNIKITYREDMELAKFYLERA